ncbi:NADPH:quinone reductase [Martiniozyma asiatica (nom. inval.)]|nr:NADPH:quinone reductase [Martiniozyma asiatica]
MIPTTQSAIYFEENGDSSVLKYSNDFLSPSIDQLKDSELIVKNKFAGVNYIETYFRKGIYPCQFPYIPGREAAGTVLFAGSNSGFEIGDKVAYLAPSNFCQLTKLDSATNKIINLGKDATDDQLQLYAGSLLQGLTALTFINEAYKVQKDDYILVTAAAGGVGLILCQLIGKIIGAHVIAVASSEEKLKEAENNGAEFLLDSSKLTYDEIKDKILEITNNEGIHAAFDSIGKDSFEMTFASMRRKGTIVSFGNASGPVPPFNIGRLSPKNLKLLRPQLFAYVATADEFNHYCKELFDLIDSGKLNIKIHGVSPLKDYKEVTDLMEARKTSGKLILEIPQ